MVVLVVTLVLVPVGLWRRVIAPRWLRAKTFAADGIRRWMTWSRKTGVNVHMIFGAATLVIGTAHGLTARSQNAYLWAGMVGIAGLLLLGTLMQWRWIPPLARQRTLMFSAKWGLCALSLGLLLYGHSLTHDRFRGG